MIPEQSQQAGGETRGDNPTVLLFPMLDTYGPEEPRRAVPRHRAPKPSPFP